MSKQSNGELSFSRWINVVLSFLFMVIGIPLLLWLVAMLVAPGGRRLIFEPPLCWGILGISLVLGFSNASYYYKRVKSKLTK